MGPVLLQEKPRKASSSHIEPGFHLDQAYVSYLPDERRVTKGVMTTTMIVMMTMMVVVQKTRRWMAAFPPKATASLMGFPVSPDVVIRLGLLLLARRV